MAAALIDRLVHHCHLVTSAATAIPCASTLSCGRRCMLRRTLNRPRVVAALVRRLRRTEARPLVDLSDFQSAELSDFGPALSTRCTFRINDLSLDVKAADRQRLGKSQGV